MKPLVDLVLLVETRLPGASSPCQPNEQVSPTGWNKLNVRLHLTAGMREFIAASAEWLTVFQLPTYAPNLNSTEGVWSLIKRGIGNLAAVDLGQITRAVKRRLKMLQYRPEAIDGCLPGAHLPLST